MLKNFIFLILLTSSFETYSQQLDYTSKTLLDGLNQPWGMDFISEDKLLITERYDAWETVARKLAHEIKNPLTPIQLTIDRLKNKYSLEIKETKDFSIYFSICDTKPFV